MFLCQAEVFIFITNTGVYSYSCQIQHEFSSKKIERWKLYSCRAGERGEGKLKEVSRERGCRGHRSRSVHCNLQFPGVKPVWRSKEQGTNCKYSVGKLLLEAAVTKI